MDFCFHAMNKLWYITGYKGCGQVSSNLCVWFQRRKQIHILGGNPHIESLRPRFFMSWTNFSTSWVMKVVVKFHWNCVCSFWEKKANTSFGGHPLIDTLRLQFFLMMWKIFGTAWVTKVMVKFNQNCVCSFREQRKCIFWGAPPGHPLRARFFNAMNNLWYITGDEDYGEVSSELYV